MSLVFGLVRTSYLPEEPAAFGLNPNMSFAERTALVHDPKRLEKRLRLFQAVCLPSLAAQPADRFTGLILTAESLPETHATQLQDLIAPYPNIHLVFRPPMPAREVFGSVLGDYPPAEDIRVTFRLDDDDAVAAGFTDHVERYRKPQNLGHALSLYAGLGLCRLYGATRLWEVKRFMSSAGLAHIDAADSRKTAYSLGNHTRVAEKVPTITDGSRVAYLQTNHGTNASGNRLPLAARLRPSTLMTQAEAAEAYGAAFPFLADGDFSFIERSDFRLF